MLVTWLATVLTVNVVPTGGMVLEGVHRPLVVDLVSAKVMLWTESMSNLCKNSEVVRLVQLVVQLLSTASKLVQDRTHMAIAMAADAIVATARKMQKSDRMAVH